ncbi:MFS transporter [Bradyrhizobium sp. CCBAU 11386]|uniref:Bug family tripartite tricarboxylate transporter substrate binding protein n=1 Tax=Bradyrhizobium sp. CCBAU 11386 TaxID=1630837 RepID=UPI0023028F76|nr:tripartite tricarboxylate transporter substrate-binding protein [Bradyrhizobium sp. CCBAU 11386]MDA9506890.1 MFS transporter [Bradyrhizobium sp. CCBAU 11386]
MRLPRRHFLRIALATIASAPGIAVAEGYPTKGVRLLVGFPAGGPVDIAGRFIAPWLSQRLSHPFSVENQPGESGNAATRSVVKAEPDGHTLLVCGPVNAINTTLFKDLDFDFGSDITPVAGLYRVPLVIEVHPSVPVRTLSEFVAFAKANPGKLKVGFAGRGTPQHVGIELFKILAGVDLTLVPYLGSTPALSDLLAGNIHAMFDPMPSSIAHLKRGELVPIAVTTLSRSANLPEVPVAADTVTGYEAGSWFGIGAPRATPKDIVQLLNNEVNAALMDPGTKARIADLGGDVMVGSQAEFQKFVAHETQKYADVIRLAGISPK